MSAKLGPVIFVKKDFMNDDYFNFLNLLREKRLIKGLYVLIAEGIQAQLLSPEHSDENGHYIRMFSACEHITNLPNPDTKSQQPIKMTVSSRYRHLQNMIENGFFTPFINKRPDFYSNKSRSFLHFYTLQRPRITLLEDIDKNSTRFQSTKESKAIVKMEGLLVAKQLEFGFISDPIQRLGSMQLLAGYLNKLIRADETFNNNIVKGIFKVIDEGGIEGELQIEASYMVDSETMIANDMVLVNYIYSSIQQRLKKSLHKITLPFEKVKILNDFDKKDSGGYRVAIDQQIDRITGTRYKIEASKEALWIMDQFGFVDEDGRPYPRQDIRLLERIGEQEGIGEDSVPGIGKINSSRKSHRYIDLTLPDFIYKLLLKAIKDVRTKLLENKNQHFDLLPMFSRDKELLIGEERGLAWVCNDFLSSMLARPGFKHGPINLQNFSNRMLISLKSKDDENRFTLRFLRMLLGKDRLMYQSGLITNSRREPKLKLLYSIIGKRFLIKVENVSMGFSPSAKLSKMVYRFTAVRLSEDEISECAHRAELINEDISYAEDDIFVGWGDAIIARADVKSSKFKTHYQQKYIDNDE
jgi:hypothetical protein